MGKAKVWNKTHSRFLEDWTQADGPTGLFYGNQKYSAQKESTMSVPFQKQTINPISCSFKPCKAQLFSCHLGTC